MPREKRSAWALGRRKWWGCADPAKSLFLVQAPKRPKLPMHLNVTCFFGFVARRCAIAPQSTGRQGKHCRKKATANRHCLRCVMASSSYIDCSHAKAPIWKLADQTVYGDGRHVKAPILESGAHANNTAVRV